MNFGYKKLYIAGELRDASDGNTFDVICPVNEKAIAKIAWATKTDTLQALESAQQGFEVWSGLPMEERLRWMDKLRAKILENRDLLRQSLMYDIEQGGELIYGGEPINGTGYYFQPTAIRLDDKTAAILQQEIFGPVAIIVPFSTQEEVIELANNTDAGLASYVYSEDEEKLAFFTENLELGEVHLNGFKFDIYLPHGGVKNSGIGVDCSTFALDDYLIKKRITRALIRT